MNISELIFTVNQHGSVKLPAPVLKEMGLYPGDHVRVAYLTENGTFNTFREFMLLPNTVDAPVADGDSSTIHIPAQLMEQASIAPDADIQIACLNGCIVIFRDDGLQPEELQAVLEGIQAVENLVSMLPDEAQQTLVELEHTINTIREGDQYDG